MQAGCRVGHSVGFGKWVGGSGSGGVAGGKRGEEERSWRRGLMFSGGCGVADLNYWRGAMFGACHMSVPNLAPVRLLFSPPRTAT